MYPISVHIRPGLTKGVKEDNLEIYLFDSFVSNSASDAASPPTVSSSGPRNATARATT